MKDEGGGGGGKLKPGGKKRGVKFGTICFGRGPVMGTNYVKYGGKLYSPSDKVRPFPFSRSPLSIIRSHFISICVCCLSACEREEPTTSLDGSAYYLPVILAPQRLTVDLLS